MDAPILADGAAYPFELARELRRQILRMEVVRNHAGMRRIRDVENRGAVGGRHVADVRVPAVDHDLTAAGQPELPYRLQRCGELPGAAHHVTDRGWDVNYSMQAQGRRFKVSSA